MDGAAGLGASEREPTRRAQQLDDQPGRVDREISHVLTIGCVGAGHDAADGGAVGLARAAKFGLQSRVLVHDR